MALCHLALGDVGLSVIECHQVWPVRPSELRCGIDDPVLRVTIIGVYGEFPTRAFFASKNGLTPGWVGPLPARRRRERNSFLIVFGLFVTFTEPLEKLGDQVNFEDMIIVELRHVHTADGSLTIPVVIEFSNLGAASGVLPEAYRHIPLVKELANWTAG